VEGAVKAAARRREPERRVALDGDEWVVFHVIGSSCALRNDEGRIMVASEARVEQAWREQHVPPRRDT
jgi:hypothetical protein